MRDETSHRLSAPKCAPGTAGHRARALRISGQRQSRAPVCPAGPARRTEACLVAHRTLPQPNHAAALRILSFIEIRGRDRSEADKRAFVFMKRTKKNTRVVNARLRSAAS
jgi:hypothetical protein